MIISFENVVRDYLALRGESPDLLPVLEEGEESPVLTLATELKAKLPAMAIEATKETPSLFLDEIRSVEAKFEMETPRIARVRMPDDYLAFHSLRMADWKEPLRSPEPVEALRWALGGNAPEWMICTERPMVKEERDAEGLWLKVYGSEAFDLPANILYVPIPEFDGETLVISRAAYLRMIKAA